MMIVEHWDEEEDGPVSETTLREKLEARGYDVSVYTYPPGTFFPNHTHSIDKIDAVLSGRFRMATADGSAILEAGDCVEILAGTVHSAEVVGDDPVVSLDGTRR